MGDVGQHDLACLWHHSHTKVASARKCENS